jgi:hypothetical protein
VDNCTRDGVLVRSISDWILDQSSIISLVTSFGLSKWTSKQGESRSYHSIALILWQDNLLYYIYC